MRVPNNLKKHFQILTEENIDINGLFSDFTSTAKERYIRMYAAPLLKLMPTVLRYFVTDIAKKMRNPSRKLKINYPLDFEENRKITERLKNTKSRPWWKKKAVICLSHDVDNDEGYAFVKAMSEINIRYGLPATFNFLTHDNYNLESALLKYLENKGFEIGLHGYTHDQGLAFRSEKKIRKQLAQSLFRLNEFSISGIRTPALSKSERIFSVLADMNIKYDSTLQTGSGIYRSVRIPYPYYFRKYDVWELPLMIQDDNYLRDAETTEDEMISSLKRILEETIVINGIAVLNFHPHLMHSRVRLYEKILSVIMEYKQDAAYKTTGDVYNYLKDNFVDLK